MILSSTSTLPEVQAAYDDNASYAEDNSVAKARAFVTACRILIRRSMTRVDTRESAIELDVSLLQAELEAAQTWLESHDTGAAGGGPDRTLADFRNFRC